MASAPNHPRPEGFTSEGGNFTFLRTLEGHLDVNENTASPDEVADISGHRNDRTFDSGNLGGDYS